MGKKLKMVWIKSKSKRRNLILSVVALIEVLMITCVSAFAWTETTSSLQIIGNGDIDTYTYTNANIGTGSGYTNIPIDLSTYVRKSGNLHFALASSANGTDFYFPKVASMGTSASSFRKGNINDKNANYLNFSFDVKSVGADKDFMFASVPTIQVGGTTKTDDSVRIAISDGTTTRIYSNSTKTESVVAATAGTSATASLNAFSNYVTGKNSLFSVSNGATKRITVTIWLQYNATKNANYTGQEISITNFKIVPTNSASTVNVSCDTSMGSVSATYSGTTSTSVRVPAGSAVSLSATPASAKYKFVGWYEGTSATGSVKSTNNPYSYTVPANGNTYNFYAKFEVNKYSVSGTAVTNSSTSTTGGTVSLAVNGTTQSGTSATVEYGSKVVFTATKKSGYTFEGWYDAATGGTQLANSSSTTYTVNSVTGTVSVYARFKSDTKYIYLKPNANWKIDDARFAYYVWNSSGSKWVDMTETSSGSGVYRAVYPDGYTNIIFGRMNPGKSENNFNDDVRWNQTNDLTISGSNNCYTVAEGAWSKGDGSWSVYTP